MGLKNDEIVGLAAMAFLLIAFIVNLIGVLRSLRVGSRLMRVEGTTSEEQQEDQS